MSHGYNGRSECANIVDGMTSYGSPVDYAGDGTMCREDMDWALRGFWRREEAERRMPVTIIQVRA